MAICASCGTNNVDDTNFFVQCGAALAPSPGAWRTPTEELNAPASGGQQSAPTAQHYTAPTPTPTFQTPPPPPVVYGQAAPTVVGYGAAAATMPYAEWGDRVIA